MLELIQTEYVLSENSPFFKLLISINDKRHEMMYGIESSMEVKLLKFKIDYIEFKELSSNSLFKHTVVHVEKFNAFIDIIQEELHQS